MSRYVVAYIDFFNNDLKQYLVENVEGWSEALKCALIQMIDNEKSLSEREQIAKQTMAPLSHDYEAAREEAGNQDWSFSVIEI